MANRWVRALGALLLAGALTAPARAATDLRVVHAEPLQLRSVTHGATKPGGTALRIRAYGRDLDLILESNASLLRQTTPSLRAALDGTSLWRGRIAGLQGSWVRLSLRDGRYEGAFWDGTELYAIAREEDLRPALDPQAKSRAGGSLIYKLSDTRGGLLAGTCGSNPESSFLGGYRGLVKELRGALRTRKVDASYEIEVAVIGDFEFTSQRGAASLAALANRMNIVDGIFSEQVGVAIVPTDFLTFSTNTDPFASSNADTLLGELADFRDATPVLRSRGLTHLVTGRRLDGTTVGMAYTGTLCEARHGVSLTESSPYIDSPLVIAHELGHNFGAPHDGVAGSSCSGTPQTFLMSPSVNGSSEFSSCSLAKMEAQIDSAACVVPTRSRDAGVTPAAPPARVLIDEPVELTAQVYSAGTSPATSILVTWLFPGAIEPQSATLAGAACTLSSNNVNCLVPELAPGASRTLRVEVVPRSLGEYESALSAASANDYDPSNGERKVWLDVVSESDISLTSPAALDVTLGEGFGYTVTVTSVGAQTVASTQVEIEVPGISIESAQVAGGACTIDSVQDVVSCTLPALASGNTSQVQLQMRTTEMGAYPGVIRAFPQDGAMRRKTFVVGTLAAHDVALEVLPTVQQAAVGAETQWTLAAHSQGVYAVNDVVVRVSGGGSLDLSFEGSPSCTPNGVAVDCNLGSIAAGQSATLQLRARADVAGDHAFTFSLLASDDVPGNDSAQAQLSALPLRDVAVHAPATWELYDQRDTLISAYLQSAGAHAATDVRAEFVLPEGFVVTAAEMSPGACEIDLIAKHVVRCDVDTLNASQAAHIQMSVRAPLTGTYTAQLGVQSASDEDPRNDQTQVTMVVQPGVNGSLSGSSEQRATAGHADVSFLLSTNHYALPDARLSFSSSRPGSQLTLIWAGGSCSDVRSCAIGTVPAHSQIPLTLRVHDTATGSLTLHGALIAAADTDGEDNEASVQVQIAEPASGTTPSGGGGSFGPLLLLALSWLAGRRHASLALNTSR